MCFSVEHSNLQLLYLQLVRDAEMLAPSEVALLPIVLMQLYKQRTRREQAAVVTHPFFEGLIKPWALEPSKMTVQVCNACILPLRHSLFQTQDCCLLPAFVSSTWCFTGNADCTHLSPQGAICMPFRSSCPDLDQASPCSFMNTMHLTTPFLIEKLTGAALGHMLEAGSL